MVQKSSSLQKEDDMTTNLSATIKKKSGNLHMTIHAGLHQSCVHLIRFVLLVCSSLQEEPDHL